jgi:hypothetical protein
MRRAHKWLAAGGLAAVAAWALTLAASNSAAPANGPRKTFYLDNRPGSNCSDAGPGTRSRPWCTLRPIGRRDLRPGQRILLRRGATWRLDRTGRGIVLTESGSPSAPLTLGAYGRASDPRPVIGAGGNGVPITIAASWWSVRDLHIRNAKIGVLIASSGTAPRRGFRLSRLSLNGNQWGIVAGYLGDPGAGLGDVRIEGVEARASGSDKLVPPSKTLCPEFGRDTRYGAALYLSGVSNAIVNRVWFHDDFDSAITMGSETKNVTVTNARFDSESASYQSCGTTANYISDVADITYANSIFARTVNTRSGDQSGIDADTDVDRLHLLNNFFVDNTGPGIELLQNGVTESDAPTDVEIRSNAFSNNSRREPFGLRGSIITGWAAPQPEAQPTGVIADNLYYEPTGFTWVYPGSTFGFSGFDFVNNVEVGSAAALFHAGEQFSCRPGGPWSYEHSADGVTWTPMDECTGWIPGFRTRRPQGAARPWVGRFEQHPPAAPSSWVARSWTAPHAGTINVRSRVLMSGAGALGCAGGNGVVAEIRSSASADPLWSGTVGYDNVGLEANLHEVAVAEGEVLRFAVSNNGENRCDATSWVPAIAYTGRSDLSLL